MNYKDIKPGETFDLLRAARVSGRKVTVIGGGTGLSTLLLGLKEYTDNITAIVTVTDDGGGSGRIRQEFGMLPPGDIRNCLLALANTSTTLSQLLNYRFTEGTLDGQSFGNLFLLAMSGICGSFEAAVARMNQFLAVTGQVLPVTAQDVDLHAVLSGGQTITGETAIVKACRTDGLRIKQVSLVPAPPQALPAVIEAIENCDVLVLGPGSLFTSIIPNLLVEGVSQAIARSSALKIYALNIMTQEGETVGFTAGEHVQAIERHAGARVIDLCVYNTQHVHQKLVERYRSEGSTQLFPDPQEFTRLGVALFGGPMLTHATGFARHDPLRLAYTIMQAAHEIAPRAGVLGEYDQFILRQE